MEINIKTVDDVKIAVLKGDIDASTAPLVTQEVLSLVETGRRIILDMTEVPFMSSAGLRVLLSLHRQTSVKEGKLLLVGLNEELQDTMSVTGFLEHFEISNTLEEGLTAQV
ncbi:MAG: STAS domain-containing protein [Nostocales cyanobacterium 94392]|nr:STAS domain-containing protein [Nostocales cyanobacterium 94392]